MNCKDVRELFGQAIDSVLPKDSSPPFFEHLATCSACRREYELEVLSKSIVRGRVKFVQTPPPVRDAILLALTSEIAPSREGSTFLRRFLEKSYSVPGVVAGLGIAAVAAFFILRSPSSDDWVSHTAPNDAINQTMKNFQLIRDGQLKPTITSCYPEGVIAYFENNGVKFAINIRPIENCDWYGALSNEYEGVKLAHVVYKMGDELMYVYQVRSDEATSGSRLRLPPAAKQALANTGWYFDPEHPNCNVVLWNENGTLCIAASTMKKDRLRAIFASR